MEEFFQKVVEIAGPQLVTLFFLILVNFLLGVAVAVKLGNFDFSELGRFLQTEIVPKIIGWGGLKLLFTYGSEGLGEFAGMLSNGLVDAVWGALVLALIGDILKKIGELGIEAVNKIPGVMNNVDQQ